MSYESEDQDQNETDAIDWASAAETGGENATGPANSDAGVQLEGGETSDAKGGDQDTPVTLLDENTSSQGGSSSDSNETGVASGGLAEADNNRITAVSGDGAESTPRRLPSLPPRARLAVSQRFDEADRLVAAAEGEWRTMILVAMRTGMCVGELLGLRWVDVDLSVGRIHVCQSYVKGHCGLPKSGKPREIPLGDDVIEALRVHRHERGPLVFCDAAGNVLTAGLLGWPLKRAVKRAGLRAIGWHVLRHTFASHLAMRGVPLKVIQELLGHASIVTTMIYAHLAPHVARDAVRVLDRARPPAAAPPPAANSAPASSSPPAIPVEVAKDRRNPADGPLTN